MYVILPFEEKYFSSKGFFVQYFGHPLMEIIKNKPIHSKKRKKIIALFPGSRQQEVKKMLMNNEIVNGLTLIALQWFFLNYRSIS